MSLGADGRSPKQATAAVRMLLASRAWSFLAGPVTLLFIGASLGQEEQGYWYTMVSVLAVASLFELGLGQALTIHAAHGGSILVRDCAGAFTGPDGITAHIGHLLRLALIWGIGAGLLFIAGVSVAGWWVLNAEASADIHWRTPWLLAVLAAGLQLAGGPALAVFEGLGDNILIARLRLCTGVVATLMVWLALSLGMGLAAVAIAPLVQALASMAFLCGVRGRACSDFLARKDSEFIWRRDFWPLQWRFALSWLAGYVIFQLATPLVFRSLNPVDAGRLGMSMTLVWALIGVGTAWSNAAAPRFGVLAATGDHPGMDHLLKRCLMYGMSLAILGAIVIVAGVAILRHSEMDLATRLLDPLPLALLLATGLSHVIMSTIAVRLRAHRREPLLVVSVAEAVVMVIALVVLTDRYGVMGVVWAFVSVHGILAAAAVIAVYARFRRQYSTMSQCGTPC